MGRRLILDTNILIAYERGTMDRSSLDDDELAIASVTVAEYRVGIELADPASRAAERARALVAIMSAVDVLDYTQATAAHHGRLLAHVRRSGSPRGAHDLIIAAHAAQTGRSILSRDAKAALRRTPRGKRNRRFGGAAGRAGATGQGLSRHGNRKASAPGYAYASPPPLLGLVDSTSHAYFSVWSSVPGHQGVLVPAERRSLCLVHGERPEQHGDRHAAQPLLG